MENKKKQKQVKRSKCEKNFEFLGYLQKRAANGATGSSAIRGMAPAGTGKKIHQYLMSIKLGVYVFHTSDEYLKKLDKETEGLLKYLPEDAKKWGMARKCLNIFFRNCAYNKYLCKYYKLNHIEPFLEVPLDSHVGKGLKLESSELPKWPGVTKLDSKTSLEFQKKAQELAYKKRVFRVHLDDYLYRGEHMQQQ
jgi:hypothetical protein